MQLIKKWNSLSLIVRICVGLAVGVVLGLTVPGLAWISLLGSLFVGALKGIAPVLVFLLRLFLHRKREGRQHSQVQDRHLPLSL